MQRLPITITKKFAAPLFTAIGYAVLAATGIMLTSSGRDHAAVWPADAIVLSMMLVRDRREWPAILAAGWAGNFVANIVARGWAPGLILYGAINMAQVLLAAHMLRRGLRGANLLADAPTFARFVFWAGVAAPLLGALAGAVTAWFNYGEPVDVSLLRWYASNALGLLILTPFLCALLAGDYCRSLRRRSGAERLEIAAMLGAIAMVAAFVFWRASGPLLFLNFVPLIVAAFRLGRLAAQAGVIIVTAMAAWATLSDHGPLMLLVADRDTHAFALQFYLAVLSLTTLPVAAVVGARHDALVALRKREEGLRLLMANATDALLHFDASGVCREAQGAVHPLLGLPPAALIGRSVAALDPGGDRRVIAAYAAATASIGTHTAEFTPRYRPEKTVEVVFKGVTDADEFMGTVATVRDVSQRKAQELALLREADTDALTGLLNRAGFERRLRQRIAAADHGPMALALIDVDHFKRINDRDGHQVGDAVLVEIARRLTAGTRADDLVGRLGGDELVILFASDRMAAARACERICRSVARAPIHREGSVAVLTSLSCGVAAWQPGMTPEELIHAADMALYEAKREGRNCVRAAA